ncbi:MAG TPA: TonB-dependent receptor plug domain-containing protein [Opitutaceae bacterium]|nr:TonB-dependent receptor plug domain-containing protein [Opitutaceae bacterium]
MKTCTLSLRRNARSRALPLAFLLAAATVQAQTTAPAAAAPATLKPDDTVVLSEFRVDTSKDRGYLAANATSGTRLNTPIKELPMQLEVITRDFIDDIGAVDFKEALAYSSGVIQDTVQSSNNFLFSPSGTGQVGALRQDGTALNIRGYNTRFLLRNGFRMDIVADTVNVGRQELVRGPQALLYGVSALAGIVNVDPRFPRGTASHQVRVSFGNEDFYRAEAYTTGPLYAGEKLRVNYGAGAVYNNQSDYTDFNDRSRFLVTPAFDIQLGRQTNLFVDLEAGRFETTGNGFQDLSDSNPSGIRNELGVAVNNVNTYGETIQVARDVFRRGKEFRWSGDDTYNNADYFNATVQLTQKVGDRLQILAGVNYNYTDTEQRTIDSQGTQLAAQTAMPTTAGRWVDTGVNPLNATQRLWKSINYQWAMPTVEKDIFQTRLDATYNFTVFGSRHDILVGRQDVQVTQTALGTAQVLGQGGIATNRSYKAFNDLSYISYEGEQVRPFRDTKFWEWNTGHYAVYQARFWNERINAIGGYRWDRYMVRQLDYTYVKTDTTQPDSNVGNWARPATYDASANSAPGAVPVIEGYRFGGKVQKEGSPTYGVSFKVNDAINVFGLSGRGIFPNTGQRDGAGNPFLAEKTKGVDLGIKADLWKDSRGTPRVSLQAGVYRTERENGIYNLFWAPQPRSNNRARVRAGVPAGGYTATGTGPGAYGVYSSGFQDFETSRPVTYLLPVSYVAPADLNNPRVTGAPQQAGFILVDYASLGAAATDPLRRALDAAASDAANRTALQTGAVGSGATGLYANNGYAFNRNSDVSYDDKSEGFDISIILNPFANYTATLGYSYIKQEVTGGFQVVDQTNSTEYDSWWNYMGVPLETRRNNKDESSYDFSGSAAGVRTIDAPTYSFNLWNRYEFTSGRLKGLDVGLGFQWRNERQSEVILTNAAATRTGDNQRFKPPYPTDLKVNGALGYRTRIADHPVRFQFNVYNLMDDQKDEAFGSSLLYINPATGATVTSTTAGAQQVTVPERAVIRYNPISFRLSATVSF